MSVSIGIGALFSPRISPAVGARAGGVPSAPFRTSIKDDLGTVLVLHAVLSATPTHAVTITKLVVEGGAKLTDHSQTEPVSLTLEAIISNTPFDDESQRDVQNRGLFFSSNTAADKRPGDPGFAEEAYAWLVDLTVRRPVLTVDRQRATYANMMLAKVSEQETSQNGDALRCTLEFTEVQFATVKKVKSKVVLSKPVKKGKIEAKKADPPNETILNRLVGSQVGGL